MNLRYRSSGLPLSVKHVVLALYMLLCATSASATSLALLDGDILFVERKVKLSAQGERSLQTLTKTVQGFSGVLSIRIIGHTDETGSAESNKALSQERADWVKQHFLRQFPGTYILSLGAGDSIPYSRSDDAAARARNQRVQIQVIGTSTAQSSR